MKMLVIGIDGGDARIVRGMDMPFLQGVLESSVQPPLKEDLINRGWAKILTGLSGEVTGALYSYPRLDGTTYFTQSYGATELQASPDARPLWSRLNEAGFRVGFMNVPTTSPAPAVEGFMVAGGGGGVDNLSDVDGDLPDGLIHPDSIAETLRQHHYIFDIRTYAQPPADDKELLEKLDTIVSRRSDAFVDLCAAQQPDFGFVCFRVTTELQYMARCDIEQIINPDAPSEAKGRSEFHQGVKEHYRVLDRAIQKVVEEIRPEQLMIVADHGAAPFRYRVNLNALLAEKGWLKSDALRDGLVRSLRIWIKKRLPKGLKKGLQANLPASVKNTIAPFQRDTTLAFGPERVPGVYVNDERFSGPVSAAEVDSLVDEMTAVINSDPRLKEIGIEAVPYRRQFPNAARGALLPDIHLSGTDEAWFVESGPLVSSNSNYIPLPSDVSGFRNPVSGVKGREPLVALDPKTASHLRAGDPEDLSATYHWITRAMGAE